MPKTKTIPVLLLLATALSATACDQIQRSLSPFYPVQDLCADDGEGCPPPPPELDQLKTP